MTATCTVIQKTVTPARTEMVIEMVPKIIPAVVEERVVLEMSREDAKKLTSLIGHYTSRGLSAVYSALHDRFGTQGYLWKRTPGTAWRGENLPLLEPK